MNTPPPVVRLPRSAVVAGSVRSADRVVPEEVAVAFTYNRMAHAVMMATPADFEDFAVGFSLAEGVVKSAADLSSLDVVVTELGVELRMWIDAGPASAYIDRRRFLAGPTGCGLCGIESLEEAMRTVPRVRSDLAVSPRMVEAALATLSPAQALNRETRAVHAAGFWTPAQGLVALREDVGRHNALDKLAGALARKSIAGRAGMVLLTSRVSVEMVQKTAILGAPIMVAVSAPTALAVRTAEACGITLIAVARGDAFEIFTHADRVMAAEARHVA
jgi:FdhD protein